MPAQFTRTVGVCLVVVLAISAVAPAATATGATADASERFHEGLLDPDEDEEEDDEAEGDPDEDEGEEDEEDENDGEDDGGDEDREDKGEDDEDENDENDGEDDEDENDGEDDWGDEDGDDESEEGTDAREEREELEADLQEAWTEVTAELSELQDGDCNEDDRDRGHGNDCDGEDADNPGNSNPQDQADPTPTATPSEPTTTATPSPTPAASETGDSTPADDGGNAAGGGGFADDGTPDADVAVAAASHEIGGFQPVRAVSVNRTTIAAGERVAIVVAVENVNDDPIDVPVELAVFGEVVAVENVTVPGNSTERVRFVQRFDAPGTYHPSVGDRTATVRVQPRSTTANTAAGNTTVPSGQVGFGALAALVALGTVLLRRR